MTSFTTEERAVLRKLASKAGKISAERAGEGGMKKRGALGGRPKGSSKNKKK